MADPKENETSSAPKNKLDLNSLSSMSLGPDWGTGRKQESKPSHDNHGSGRGPRKTGSRPPRRDRRGDKTQRRHDTPDRSRAPRSEPFQPILSADFYADEEPFKVLANAIRTSYRTFELFEIAQLILEKPDRWVCVAKHQEQREGEGAKLFASVPDGLPFLSEAEALNHVFKHHVGEFFEMETVEVDPPSGSFPMVHRCGFTGKLLAPPNYHRYQAICRQHHATNLSNMAYDRFEAKLESVKEEEAVQEWLDSMKSITRYTSKTDPEAKFDSLEDARLYLITKSKDVLVRPALSARFTGKSLHLLDPRDPIRRSIEFLHIGQQKFPLETANHLRGRLRRMNFAVYKKGSKGVSYVCAVKRRFRKPDETLADNLQAIIDFVEAHPNFPASKLPEEFLGIKTTPVASPETSSKPSESEEEVPSNPEQALEKAEAVKPEITETKRELSEPEKNSLKDLKRDMKYLVSEGYVIEYSDGKLFVPPIREEEINRLAKKEGATKESVEAPVKETQKAEEAKVESSIPEAAPVEENKEEGAPVVAPTSATLEAEKAPVTKEPKVKPIAPDAASVEPKAKKEKPAAKQEPVIEAEKDKAEGTEPTEEKEASEEKA